MVLTVSCTDAKGESFPELVVAAAASHVSRAQPSMGKGRETLVTCRHQSSLLKDYRRMHKRTKGPLLQLFVGVKNVGQQQIEVLYMLYLFLF